MRPEPPYIWMLVLAVMIVMLFTSGAGGVFFMCIFGWYPISKILWWRIAQR